MELSLYQIENELCELIDLREQTAPESDERIACDRCIAEYFARELDKVDGVRAFAKHCELVARAAKEEAEAQTKRQRVWEDRLKWLKSYLLDTLVLTGRTKLEGRTGVIRRQNNGGKLPVIVSQPDMVPTSMCRGTIRLTAAMMAHDKVRTLLDTLKIVGAVIETEPDLEAIATELGSGGAVPGCSMGERGQHVRIE